MTMSTPRKSEPGRFDRPVVQKAGQRHLRFTSAASDPIDAKFSGATSSSSNLDRKAILSVHQLDHGTESMPIDSSNASLEWRRQSSLSVISDKSSRTERRHLPAWVSS